MKQQLLRLYRFLHYDNTLVILAISSAVGYLLIFILSKILYSSKINIPSFITYIFAINTILSISVLKKDKLSARLLMSFNLIIEIICLICILKSLNEVI